MKVSYRLLLVLLLSLVFLYSFLGYFLSGDLVDIPRGELTVGVEKTTFDRILLKNSRFMEINKDFLSGLQSQKNHELQNDIWANQYEIRNKDYQLFIDYLRENDGHQFFHPEEPKNKKHTPQVPYLGMKNFDNPLHPVAWIDWWDAFAFCKWAGGRLPNDDEWERLARYNDGRLYPWGNYSLNSSRSMIGKPNTGRIQEVGSYPLGKSPEGLYDLIGNVKEWTMGLPEKKACRIKRGGII